MRISHLLRRCPAQPQRIAPKRILSKQQSHGEVPQRANDRHCSKLFRGCIWSWRRLERKIEICEVQYFSLFLSLFFFSNHLHSISLLLLSRLLDRILELQDLILSEHRPAQSAQESNDAAEMHSLVENLTLAQASMRELTRALRLRQQRLSLSPPLDRRPPSIIDSSSSSDAD